MSEDTTTTTETPADAGVVEPATQETGEGALKALKAERDARKQAEKSSAELAARLKAFEDANKTDLERAQAAAAEAAAELVTLRTENTRNAVAIAKGVPADLIPFLTGDTEADMAAKADLLMSRLSAPGIPKPDPSQGAGVPAHALNGDPLLADLKNKLGIVS